MIHHQRTFGVITVQSVGELVDNLTEHTWTLCTGFSFEGLLFLNDSFSEDGAQEYAVVRNGRQIESLTVSWMSRAEAWSDVDWLVRGGGGDYGVVDVLTEPSEGHRCGLCE
jgi:hypothetical protein